MMAALYAVSVPAIKKHLKRIFSDNELEPEATVKKYLIVQTEGSRQVERSVEHIDYDGTAAPTKRFFATVQNKFHWAIHRQTAAEVIVSRADATKDRMGLTTWKDEPKGKIQKYDLVVAKNYLTESEMAQLQRLVSYLDLVEDMALREIPMTMQDWETRLNRFIAAACNERHKGRCGKFSRNGSSLCSSGSGRCRISLLPTRAPTFFARQRGGRKWHRVSQADAVSSRLLWVLGRVVRRWRLGRVHVVE